jgi:hypothetical protein
VVSNVRKVVESSGNSHPWATCSCTPSKPAANATCAPRTNEQMTSSMSASDISCGVWKKTRSSREESFPPRFEPVLTGTALGANGGANGARPPMMLGDWRPACESCIIASGVCVESWWVTRCVGLPLWMQVARVRNGRMDSGESVGGMMMSRPRERWVGLTWTLPVMMIPHE